MIKLVALLRRLPTLSREEFQEYWLNQHAPLWLTYKNTLKATEYHQHHTVSTPIDAGLKEGRGDIEPYDGIAEICWDSLETVEVALSHPDAETMFKTLLEDEQKFVDWTRSTVWFCKTHTLLS